MDVWSDDKGRKCPRRKCKVARDENWKSFLRRIEEIELLGRCFWSDNGEHNQQYSESHYYRRWCANTRDEEPHRHASENHQVNLGNSGCESELKKTTQKFNWKVSFKPLDAGEKILYLYLERFPHNQQRFAAFKTTPLIMLKGKKFDSKKLTEMQLTSMFAQGWRHVKFENKDSCAWRASRKKWGRKRDVPGEHSIEL